MPTSPSAYTGPSLLPSIFRKQSTPCRRAICAALLALSMSPLSTAVYANPPGAEAGKEAAAPTQAEILREIDPSSWKLSPEAEHLYYYLLLSDGLAANDQLIISQALQGLLKLDPSLPVFQDSATIMLARGEFAGAEKLATRGLQHFPEDTLLTLLLAGSYSESGQIPKAITALEAHLKSHPKAHEVIQELIRLYLKEGLDKKATDLLSKLPESDQTPSAVLFRAKVLATVGRNAEARVHLRRLLKKEPEFFEAWLELGIISEREKDFPEAISSYKKAVELDDDSLEIWFRIARLQIEQKNPHEALLTIEKAPGTSQLYMQSALRFADGGYFREAEAMLEKAEKDGGNPDEIALFRSVLKQEATKDPLAGLPPLEGITPASPLYPNAQQRKAQLYMHAKQYQKAFDTASTARQKHPDRKELWGIEAYALVKLEKPAEAEALLQKALAEYPGDEDLLFSLGSIQDEAGKKDEALQTMESLIKTNPKNASALNYVGYTLAEKNKDLDRALALITAALEENPDADYIVDSLAWAQYRLGKFEDAWKSINRCIKLGGDEPAIWEHYAEIALALGKKQEAEKGYNEAIKRSPDNIDDLRNKLAKLRKK